MHKIGLFLLFICGSIVPVFSQTNAEKLEQAVKIYNNLRDYEDKFKPESVTQSDVEKMKADRADATVLLEAVRENGTAEESKVARYFMANFNYEIGYVYGMMGKNKDAYALLSTIKADYEYFSSSYVFPLTYKFNSQSYSITYENFAPTLAEYYTGMAEICANLNKQEESMEWSRKTLAFSYTTDWYKYIALNKLMDMKEKNNEWDKEMMDCGLQQITLATQLDTSYQRTIKEYNYPNAEYGAKKIQSTIEKKPSLANGEYHRGTAAPILARAKKYRLALEFYRAALEGGFGMYDKSYLFEAARFAIREENNYTAILALDLVYNKNSSSLSCDEWSKLSEMYGEAGNSEKKNNCSSKAEECRKKIKKEEKQRNSGSLGFGIYGGVYPLALATRFNRYRDYGGVFGIIAGKVAIEGSYKLINRNFIITDDLMAKQIKQEFPYYWEGYRAHVALKFYPKAYSGSTRFYIGPLVELVDRTYEPVWSDVTNTSNGLVYATDQKFYPHDKSYNLFLNMGSQTMEKGFYIDTFMGFGVAYSKFDAGAEYADGQYTFSDVLLENRKATRFSPMIRMGMTVGLGWVKK